MVSHPGRTVTALAALLALLLAPLCAFAEIPAARHSIALIIDDLGNQRLAIANPRLAPYGRAAQQVLEGLGLWLSLQPRLVRGENIGQAFQFVASGNAELGFVALSQLIQSDRHKRGSMWRIPEDLYAPIEQQAVLLTQDPAAQAFMDFVQGEPARAIIRAHGYGTP